MLQEVTRPDSFWKSIGIPISLWKQGGTQWLISHLEKHPYCPAKPRGDYWCVPRNLTGVLMSVNRQELWSFIPVVTQECIPGSRCNSRKLCDFPLAERWAPIPGHPLHSNFLFAIKHVRSHTVSITSSRLSSSNSVSCKAFIDCFY